MKDMDIRSLGRIVIILWMGISLLAAYGFYAGYKHNEILETAEAQQQIIENQKAYIEYLEGVMNRPFVPRYEPVDNPDVSMAIFEMQGARDSHQIYLDNPGYLKGTWTSVEDGLTFHRQCVKNYDLVLTLLEGMK